MVLKYLQYSPTADPSPTRSQRMISTGPVENTAVMVLIYPEMIHETVSQIPTR